jgi:hypothetical protein
VTSSKTASLHQNLPNNNNFACVIAVAIASDYEQYFKGWPLSFII